MIELNFQDIVEKLIKYNAIPEGKFGAPLQKPYEDFVKANAFTVTILNDYNTLLNYQNQKKRYKNDKDTLEGINESISYYEESIIEGLERFEEWYMDRVNCEWSDN